MSVYYAIRCDRCDRHFDNGDHCADRAPLHAMRAAAKSSNWRVQVNGIAPHLWVKQGTLDFCPGCVAWWDVEDAKARPT